MKWELASITPPDIVITVLIMYRGDYEFGMYNGSFWRVYIDNSWQIVPDQKNITHWYWIEKPEI